MSDARLPHPIKACLEERGDQLGLVRQWHGILDEVESRRRRRRAALIVAPAAIAALVIAAFILPSLSEPRGTFGAAPPGAGLGFGHASREPRAAALALASSGGVTPGVFDVAPVGPAEQVAFEDGSRVVL